MKGIIALDIDGTITVSKDTLEESVNLYLNQLIAAGWTVVFVTGRTFAFATPILKNLVGEFFLAVQNGAALYAMPKGKCLYKKHLSSALLKDLLPIFNESECGLLIESGKENGDLCFYNPKDFSPQELAYITFRISMTPEPWVPIGHLDDLPIDEFAVGKYFAEESGAFILAEKIQTLFALNVTVIRDPFRPGYHLAHVHEKQATKGTAVEAVSLLCPKGPIVTAGDDYNDLDMLKKGSLIIVMENGPKELREMADIVAPPAEKQGIIQGLEEALWKVSYE